MATFPPRVFGYRPCLCDHETHVKRAKKWRHNAKQAYLKMVESPLVSATIMVDFKKMEKAVRRVTPLKKSPEHLQDFSVVGERFKQTMVLVKTPRAKKKTSLNQMNAEMIQKRERASNMSYL